MNEIIKKRLREANDAFEEALVVYESKVSNLATLTKLYHAMIYSIMALFEIENIGNLTHADLIARFEDEYVSKGLASKELLDALRLAYNYTHECDCLHTKEPTSKEVEYLFRLAEDFVDYVSKTVDKPF